MNSRNKRRFRSYGMTEKEAKEVLAELNKNESKVRNVHCDYMYNRGINEKIAGIIKQARALYICGKHAGSKPISRLEKHIRNMNRKVSKYVNALKALEKIKKAEEEAAKENVD